MITLQSLIKRNESLLVQELEDELVIADLASGSYYGLGENGQRIWQLLDQPLTVDQICAALVQEYDVDRAECERDVLPFLEKLLAKEIVSTV